MRYRSHVVKFCLSVFLILLVRNPVAAQTAIPPVTTTCEDLLPPDRPTFSGANAPTIRFSAPVDGSDLYGTGVTISVDIQNFDLSANEGRHWHLWVNGQLQGMVYQPSTIIDLEPGSYQICASLGDSNHADMGQPAEVLVTVYEAAAGTPTSAPAIPAETVGELIVEPGVTPGQIALIVGMGLAAAVGGWWLGSRLPKGKN